MQSVHNYGVEYRIQLRSEDVMRRRFEFEVLDRQTAASTAKLQMKKKHRSLYYNRPSPGRSEEVIYH